MNQQMTEDEKQAAREARNAYYREWNRNHPDKRREYNERYWSRKFQEAQPQRAKEGESGNLVQAGDSA